MRSIFMMEVRATSSAVVITTTASLRSILTAAQKADLIELLKSL